MLIAVVIVVVVLWIVIEFGGTLGSALKNLLTQLGITKPAIQTQAEGTIQQTSAASSNPSSPWSPNLYNSNPDASTLDYGTLQSMAQQINGSVSILPNWLISPNASEALAAIKNCNNQIDVSNLVVVYSQMYSSDLYTFLEMNYTSAPNEVILQQIIQFVNNLPTT